VRVLVDTHNFRVIVQPSSLRIFSNDEYIKAGALVDEDLSEACLILGIKKMSLKTIQPGKSYMFFGHVIKAQKSNFDILDKLLNSKVTLTLHSC
jgi:Alanine dehydrogenase/PNT, N-terminal domain